MPTVRQSAWEVVTQGEEMGHKIGCLLCLDRNYGTGLIIKTRLGGDATLRICPKCVTMIRDLG